MSSNGACACEGAPTLIFPCSGSSDVGAITDQAARQLTRAGVGRMYCLAGIGGRVNGIMLNTQAAGRILAIDGCPQDCASKCLEQGGFTDFARLRLADIGLTKGASPVTPESIGAVAKHAADLLLASAQQLAVT